jgi:hypothetical protein
MHGRVPSIEEAVTEIEKRLQASKEARRVGHPATCACQGSGVVPAGQFAIGYAPCNAALPVEEGTRGWQFCVVDYPENKSGRAIVGGGARLDNEEECAAMLNTLLRQIPAAPRAPAEPPRVDAHCEFCPGVNVPHGPHEEDAAPRAPSTTPPHPAGDCAMPGCSVCAAPSTTETAAPEDCDECNGEGIVTRAFAVNPADGSHEWPCPKCQDRWEVTFICCGREDGKQRFATYEEASARRDFYMSGPGVSTKPGEPGHDRSAIIRACAPRSPEATGTAAQGDEAALNEMLADMQGDGDDWECEQVLCGLEPPDGFEGEPCSLPEGHAGPHFGSDDEPGRAPQSGKGDKT